MAAAAYVTLRNGVQMPSIGLGTFKLQGDAVRQVVGTAVRLGYRHIDTASVYKNETQIGETLAHIYATNPAITRSALFITSKIAPKSQGYDEATQAIAASIAALGAGCQGYIDLMLIHWPGSQGRKPHDPRNAANRAGTWRALCDAMADGRLRAIGVSNYTDRHLDGDEFGDNGGNGGGNGGVVPLVNQVELHPMVWTPVTRRLVGLCRERGIVVQAYSCLGTGDLVSALPLDCRRVGATPAQVLIRWALERCGVVMPKASSEARLKENLDALHVVLGHDDYAALDSLAERVGAKKFCWDPTLIA
ncbi:NADP-dependent oxidoreductase domain-containing protein [Entophlyctis helioformis]|nr:NADP-dependent oxidoreductase domain-containing protein [Entophlyctis helioformis]